VPLWRGALWLTLPAVTSVSLFLALDWRGAMIRAAETMHPLPPRTSTPPEVEALRAQARRGEVPVADYLEARSLLGPGDTGPAPGHRNE
jgi:hypothetical protein